MFEIFLAVLIIGIKFGISVMILNTLPDGMNKTLLLRYVILILTKNLLIFALVIYFMQQSEYDKVLFYMSLGAAYIVFLPFEFNYTRKYFLKKR